MECQSFNLNLLQFKIAEEFLISADDAFELIDAPLMCFFTNPFLHAGLFVQVSVVEHLFTVLRIKLVTISFLIATVLRVFESVAIELVVLSVDNNSFIKGLARHAVFNSSYDLKSVFV